MWKTDIIHAHNTFPCGFTAAKVSVKNKLPLLITPHGMDIHVIPELGFGHRLDPQKRKMSDFALEKAELTTAISDNIKKSLNEAGVADHKIRIIPNGIDLERFQKKIDINIRHQYGFPDDAHIILSVGNYHKRKGLEHLIEAMPWMLRHNEKVRLIIVGRSDDVLKTSVENLKLNEKVILTGPIRFPALFAKDHGATEPDLLAAIYTQSDIYASASMDEGAEGLSLALLDATAAGLPIVATDISGNRDIVTNGQNGFLVPVQSPQEIAEGVLKILADPESKAVMGEKSLNIATDYSWQSVAHRYVETYAEVIDRHRRKF
jgi:glycosyltransferase involved in cell wall biosynthesis